MSEDIFKDDFTNEPEFSEDNQNTNEKNLKDNKIEENIENKTNQNELIDKKTVINDDFNENDFDISYEENNVDFDEEIENNNIKENQLDNKTKNNKIINKINQLKNSLLLKLKYIKNIKNTKKDNINNENNIDNNENNIDNNEDNIDNKDNITFENENGEILEKTEQPKKNTLKNKIIVSIIMLVLFFIMGNYVFTNKNTEVRKQHIVKTIKHISNKENNITTINKKNIKSKNIKKINNSDDKIIRLKQQNNTQALNLKKTMSYKQANKNENINERMNRIESSIKILLNNNQNKNGKSESEIKYEKYKKLIISLNIRKVLLDNGDVLTWKEEGDKFYTIISNDVSAPIKNEVLPLVIDDGAMVKIVASGVEYVILKNSNNELKWDIWKIDPLIGLKKLVSKQDYNIALKIYKDNLNNTNDQVIVNEYKKNVVLLDTNAQVIEVLDYKNSGKSIELSKLGTILHKETILGFSDLNFNNYSVRDSNFYKDGELDDTDTASKYELQWVKLKDFKTKQEKDYIIVIKNGSIKMKLNLDDLRNIYFQQGTIIKNGKKIIYVKKGDKLLIFKGGNIFEPVGDGDIISKVKNGKILNKKIYLYNTITKKIKIEKFAGNTFKGNGIYKITKSNLIVLQEPNNNILKKGEYVPLSNISLYSNSDIKYNGLKFDKINEIVNDNKVGVYITTPDYSLSLYTKDKYELLNKKNNKIDKSEKLRFKLNPDKETLTAYIPSNIIINKKKKEINGIKYKKYDYSNNTYYLYNENGQLIKEIKELKNIIKFDEKIIDFIPLKDGNIFQFFYKIDTKTGTIQSNKFGKLVKKFNRKDGIYSEFNNNKQRNLIGKQTISAVINNDLPISIIYNKNILINKFEFVSGKNKIRIFGANEIKINKQIISIKSGIYNTQRNLLEFILPKKLGSREKSYLKNLKQSRTNLLFYVDKINFDYNDFYDEEQKIFVFKNGNSKIIKDNNKYYELNSEIYDFKNNKILMTVLEETSKLKNIYININKIVKINKATIDILKIEYGKEKKVEHKNEVARKSVSDLEIKTLENELKNEQKGLQKLTGKKLKLKEYMVMNKKEIKKSKTPTEPDFIFDIGMKVQMSVKEMIEIPANQKETLIIGNLETNRLRDLQGHEIFMKGTPKVVFKATGDFNTNKVYLKPLIIEYVDRDTGIKNHIKIPEKATQLVFTDIGKKGIKYSTNGIPAFKHIAKFKNLNTMITLEAISGMIKYMTTPQDGLSQMMATSTEQTEQTLSSSAKSGAMSGAKSGLEEIVQIMKEQANKEQDILITNPNIKFNIVFIDNVNVIEKK